MNKYKSKPVIKEASQFFSNAKPIRYNHELCRTEWEYGVFQNDVDRDSPNNNYIYQIQTQAGLSIVNNGDYIIKEIDGSGYYPCAKEIFEKIYEEYNPTFDSIQEQKQAIGH